MILERNQVNHEKKNVMYFYLWNQWQILPEKLLIRKFRLLLTFYTIQHLHSYGKSNLGSSLIRTTPIN